MNIPAGSTALDSSIICVDRNEASTDGPAGSALLKLDLVAMMGGWVNGSGFEDSSACSAHYVWSGSPPIVGPAMSATVVSGGACGCRGGALQRDHLI